MTPEVRARLREGTKYALPAGACDCEECFDQFLDQLLASRGTTMSDDELTAEDEAALATARARIADFPAMEARALAAEAALSEQRGPECIKCGEPQTRNPHPDAGNLNVDPPVGYVWECIPCNVAGSMAWMRRAQRAEAALSELRESYGRQLDRRDRAEAALSEMLAADMPRTFYAKLEAEQLRASRAEAALAECRELLEMVCNSHAVIVVMLNRVLKTSGDAPVPMPPVVEAGRAWLAGSSGETGEPK